MAEQDWGWGNSEMKLQEKEVRNLDLILGSHWGL